jgi:predicted Zn-dependent protease
VRLIALAAFTATLWAFAFSGVVPSLAANKTSSAVVAASSASRPVLEHALATAQDASRLNPLSDAGLLASATISLHLGNPRQARAYLLEAINRDPEDVQAWGGLAYVETRLGDHANWIAAIRRVATLDPLGSETAALIRAAELLTVPPADSATARPTPPLSSLSGF